MEIQIKYVVEQKCKKIIIFPNLIPLNVHLCHCILNCMYYKICYVVKN